MLPAEYLDLLIELAPLLLVLAPYWDLFVALDPALTVLAPYLDVLIELEPVTFWVYFLYSVYIPFPSLFPSFTLIFVVFWVYFVPSILLPVLIFLFWIWVDVLL